MVARFAGAGLGLFAFAVTVIAGLVAHNPVATTLSRSILALFVFCAIGLVLGAVAQMVIDEHEKKRESEIHERYREEPPAPVQVTEKGAGEQPDVQAET